MLCGALPSLLFAQTFSSIDTVHIPDAPGPEVYDSVFVSGLPTVIDTSFGLTGVCFDLNHTYDSDLLLRLKSPNGNTIFIANAIGTNGDNFFNTCLAQNGANGWLVNGIAPFTGTWIPLESLNQLNNGQNPNGWWYFAVHDVAGADSGNVTNFAITFGANPPLDPPPPPPQAKLCNGCICPDSAAGPCDLLPDMTSSELSIMEDIDPLTRQSDWETVGNVNWDNVTPNIGYGPLEIRGVDTCYCGTSIVPCSTSLCPNGDPVKQVVHQVIYQKINVSDTLSQYERTAGYMSYHPSHGHIHVDHWADFTLRSPTANPDATTWPIVGTGTKTSFCLINLGTCDGDFGYCVDTAGTPLHNADIPNSGLGFNTGCDTTQGIYVGSLDIYVVGLNMGIDLTGVCNGDYYLVSITDPENNMLESNENNNWVAVPVTLTKQTGANHTLTMLSALSVQGNAFNLSAATSYTWDFGDGSALVNNINPATHTYTANGTYYVTLTVNAPCGSMTQVDTVQITTVGINILSSSPEFITATPNPVKENITLTYNLNKAGKASVSIYDLAGKNIADISNETENAGLHTITYNAKQAGIASGTYLIRYITEGNVYTQKISIAE